jgi:glycosidase
MKRVLVMVLSFLMLFSFMVPLSQTAAANEYSHVVIRGSEAPLDWGSNNNPLTKNADGTWSSQPLAFEGGQKIEFKYVYDGNWMPGGNLEFVTPQTGEYVFVFHPNDERRVDVYLQEQAGKATLEVTLPSSTPDWVTPTVGTSLGNFNYTVTKMTRVDGQTWTVELSGEPGQSFTYLYALGDSKFVEDRDKPRQATFSEDNPVYSDVVENFKGVPVAQSVTHNFTHKPYVPSSKDEVTVEVTVDHYGPIDAGAIYYTVDGTAPAGKRGEAENGFTVPLQVESTKTTNDLHTSVLTGVIPAQKNETRVKYKLDVWNTESEGSQFADNNSQTAAEATEFAYYVDQFTSPDWAKDAVIYHIFVDRFKDGNPLNNEAVDPAAPYEELLKGWMGGDLAGVKEKLDYIDNLGVNAIWLSPVFEGPYSHGYHPTNFIGIDSRFGDEALMKEIIAEAQKRGIKVIYDLVPNHTSNKHPFFQDAQAKGTDSKYYNWYNFTEWPNKYETFYGIGELPQFNNDHPEARAHMLEEVVPYWLTELGFDGFRLDYAKGPSYSFWVDFRHAVKQIDKDAYIFGEVWDSREKIDSYTGKLDGALDFGMQSALLDVFAYNRPMTRLSETIQANLSTYHPEYVMTSFLDNHDVPRFLHEAGNNVNKLKNAATAQFALPGSPVIYYGTEVGLSQSKDHHSYSDWKDRWYREMMPWEEEEQNLELLAFYQNLIELRVSEPALSVGSYKELYADRNVLVFERKHKNKTFVVAINNGDGSKTVPVMLEKKNHGLQNALNRADGVLSDKSGKIDLSIGSGSAVIYEVVAPGKLIAHQKKDKAS